MTKTACISHTQMCRTIITVCTKFGFSFAVDNFADGLLTNRRYCNRSDAIAFNNKFAPTFDVDWCSFRLVRVPCVSFTHVSVQENATYGLRRARDGQPSDMTSSGSAALSRSLLYTIKKGAVMRSDKVHMHSCTCGYHYTGSGRGRLTARVHTTW